MTGIVSEWPKSENFDLSGIWIHDPSGLVPRYPPYWAMQIMVASNTTSKTLPSDNFISQFGTQIVLLENLSSKMTLLGLCFKGKFAQKFTPLFIVLNESPQSYPHTNRTKKRIKNINFWRSYSYRASKSQIWFAGESTAPDDVLWGKKKLILAEFNRRRSQHTHLIDIFVGRIQPSLVKFAQSKRW